MSYRHVWGYDSNRLPNDIDEYEHRSVSTSERGIELQEMHSNELGPKNNSRTGLRHRFRPYRPINRTNAYSFGNSEVEETPLLENATSSASTAIELGTEAAAIDGITTGIGTYGAGITAGAIGTGLAIGGVAIGAQALYKRTQKKGLVLPGSDFIGPGNTVPIGAAKSPADQVAKVHDVEYSNIIANNSLSKEEHFKAVQDADRKAIQDFANVPGLHARIGEYGLKAKASVENTLKRPLYPQCKYLYTNNVFVYL